MKICGQCGTRQTDERSTCLDCGAVLRNPVPKALENAFEQETKDVIQRLSHDEWAIGIWDKTIGFLALGGLVLLVIMICFFPKVYDKTNFLITIVCFLMAALVSLAKRFFWAAEKWRLGFRVQNTQNLKPSALYLIWQKISACLFLAIGVWWLISGFIV